MAQFMLRTLDYFEYLFWHILKIGIETNSEDAQAMIAALLSEEKLR